jgi:ABC-2 type transport system permease protein
MVPKVFLAYSLWFWVGLVLNTIAMTILVFFWQAVYSNTETIAGLDLNQTLTYILLAQVFAPLIEINLIFEFGYSLREGGIAHALLRPIDFQGGMYAQYMMQTFTALLLQIPMALVAWLVFGLRFPHDIQAWAIFIVSALLGRTILFFFDWMLACLTFYTTEVWGLGVLVYGLSLFFSGSLVPLAMVPGWLQTLALATPFAQALYVPLSFLTGITPLSQAPTILAIQVALLIGFGIGSRLFFRVAVRKITVQGG